MPQNTQRQNRQDTSPSNVRILENADIEISLKLEHETVNADTKSATEECNSEDTPFLSATLQVTTDHEIKYIA